MKAQNVVLIKNFNINLIIYVKFCKKNNKDMVISSIKLWNVKYSKENTNPEKISMQYWRNTWLLYN